MIPVVTPAEMAGVDRRAPEPVEVLVERAGYAVAGAARRLLGGAYGRRVKWSPAGVTTVPTAGRRPGF